MSFAAVSPSPACTVCKIKSADVVQDLDVSPEELEALLELTQELKTNPIKFTQALANKYIVLLFEKPSLRTRLTFELAIKQLGGDCVVQTGMIGDREPLKDVARNLDRWAQAVVARTFSQQTVEELARWSSVPVVNALSDAWHPCQALADVFTMRERWGSLRGRKVAFIGDGNNVAKSLMVTALRLGAHFALACPPGYEPQPAVLDVARQLAQASRCELLITNVPALALTNADAVCTDVWASMGHEAERQKRLSDFEAYRVNGEAMAQAKRDALFLHCLPAHRGEEVTDEVIESPQSAVFDEAENRLHTQKALLLMLLS